LKDLLIIFTRNPELGKCKTRLAATVGDEVALEVYLFLLKHTISITEDLPVIKQVHYSIKIRDNDLWNEAAFIKKQQIGDDLGTRMHRAFQQGFEDGYKRIIIIGSDMFDLDQQDLEEAFSALNTNDFVIGPAEDGGYYLLGMRSLKAELFQNKNWGTSSVLKDTLSNLKNEKLHLLLQKNDIDDYEDIMGIEEFHQFLNPSK
jgi:hypothetical protein